MGLEKERRHRAALAEAGLKIWFDVEHPFGGRFVCITQNWRSIQLALSSRTGFIALRAGVPWEWPWTRKVPRRLVLGFLSVWCGR